MSKAIMSYQHSLPAPQYEQLCALPEVIARYTPEARGTKVWEQIRRDCVDLPCDPQTGHRLLEVDNESQDSLLALLDWAANRSGDERFAWLAQEMRDGAEESDRTLREQSHFN